jgi:hypothetical protein
MPDFPGDSRVEPAGKMVENGAKMEGKWFLLRFHAGRFRFSGSAVVDGKTTPILTRFSSDSHAHEKANPLN